MILLFSLILLPLFSFICSIFFSNLVNKKILGYFSSILIIIASFNSLLSNCCYCDNNNNSSDNSYFILAILFFNLAAFSYVLLFPSKKAILLGDESKNFLENNFQELSPENIPAGAEIEKNLVPDNSNVFDIFIQFLDNPLVQDGIYFGSPIIISACIIFLFGFDPKGNSSPLELSKSIKPNFTTESVFLTSKPLKIVNINPFVYPNLNFVEPSFRLRKDLLLIKASTVHIVKDNIVQNLPVELVKVLPQDFLQAISQVSVCYLNNKEEYFFLMGGIGQKNFKLFLAILELQEISLSTYIAELANFNRQKKG